MPEPLLHSITRLLRYQRAPERATSLFAKWKHNADILPKLQTQLEMVLSAYGKFREVVYDTQGILDDGSDVIVRVPPSGGDLEQQLICFQVKSFGDLSKPSYMQEIKAQHDDTTRKVRGLNFYFLLLCTDMSQHKAKVRNIMAEFRSTPITEIIEPAFAYTFLHHTQTRVDAFVKRSVESEDLVFRQAFDDLGEFESPSAKALAIFIAVKAALTGETVFHQDQLLSNPTLHSIYSELREKQAMLLDESIAEGKRRRKKRRSPDDWDWDDENEPIQIAEFEEQLAADLEMVEVGIVVPLAGTSTVKFLTDQARALTAVITDAVARYEYQETQLMTYMFDVMGIRD